MVTLQLSFTHASEWRNWLKKNHSNDLTVWLVFYKKDSGNVSMNYEDAVNEALCFGWIDSIIKKIDDKKYVRKFTRRKDESNWSEINKRRAEKLIEEKKMTPAGMSKIVFAKKSGQWNKINKPSISFEIPAEFQIALDKNKTAKTNFEKLTFTRQKQFIGWINAAKLKDTKQKRIRESISLLAEGKELGLK